LLLAHFHGTVTAALRVLGLSDDLYFQKYHRVLNRARWSAHHAADILLRLLVRAFVPAGPVVSGLDDTVERRRGAKIAGRSMYRDAVRSNWGCFQKTIGLRWIGLHLIALVRWAKRTWALPLLTALAPSGNNPACVRAGRRHKPLSERARGLIGQAQRWLPGRELIVVADGGYAVLDLLAWCQRLAQPITMISRLCMDGAQALATELAAAPAQLRRQIVLIDVRFQHENIPLSTSPSEKGSSSISGLDIASSRQVLTVNRPPCLASFISYLVS
jgi:hypothetical protein